LHASERCWDEALNRVPCLISELKKTMVIAQSEKVKVQKLAAA